MSSNKVCLYCASNSFEKLFENVVDRLRYAPGKWSFLKCKNCGSACLNPRPETKELAAFYPPNYSFSNESESNSLVKRLLFFIQYQCILKLQYTSQARRIQRSLGVGKEQKLKILDIGCGSGLRLLEFARFGHKVYGSDIRPDVVQFFTKKYNISGVCANASELDKHFPPASFDLIMAFHLLEHVTDIKDVMNNIFLLLKPGGSFVATVPLISGVQPRFFKSKWAAVTEAPRHVTIPSPQGIKSVCEEAGFNSAKIKPGSFHELMMHLVLSIFPQTAPSYQSSKSPFKLMVLLGIASTIGLLT